MAEPPNIHTLEHNYTFQPYTDIDGKTWVWRGSDLRYVQLIDSEQAGEASIPTPSDETFVFV